MAFNTAMYLHETLSISTVASTALDASTVATSIIPAAAKPLIKGNWLRVGSTLRLTLCGNLSCVVTTPGTFILDVRLGNVIVFTSAAMALNVVAKTALPFYAQLLLTVRAIGSGTSANIMTSGIVVSETIVGSPVPAVGGAGALVMPVTTMAVGTGFDSTVDNTLDVFGKFSVNTAGTTYTNHLFLAESLNSPAPRIRVDATVD